MKNSELIQLLGALPAELEVMVCSQEETVQIPLSAEVESTCNEDPKKPGQMIEVIRLYTDNGDRD